MTCNFSGTKLAKFWCQNGQKGLKKREPPSEIGLASFALVRFVSIYNLQ